MKPAAARAYEARRLSRVPLAVVAAPDPERDTRWTELGEAWEWACKGEGRSTMAVARRYAMDPSRVCSFSTRTAALGRLAVWFDNGLVITADGLFRWAG
jgi:hypothetical protein